MNPTLNEWLNLIFRWIHVIAGVLWIGHLYFFNFVNAQVAKTYSADAKKTVVPELMPRALYWFRWGAAWTWISGILLLGIVYYMGGALLEAGSTMSAGLGAIIGLAVMFIGFLVYDLLWKTGLKASPPAGTAVSLILLAVVTWYLSTIFSPRAVFIHIGAILGTIMAANVWMRIWPSQRKIIAALKAGQAPDAALAGLAGLRSKHNTYMSVPLLFLMVSNHYPGVYGTSASWIIALALVVIGFLLTWFFYNKSASEAPTRY